jgi:MFS family permease
MSPRHERPRAAARSRVLTHAESIRVGLRDALATHGLRRLAFAWLASAIGGWAFMVSLAVYAYAQGGAAAVGLAALVRMVPAALAAPFAGVVGDRYSRRDVLIAAAVGRAATLAAIAAVVAAGAALAAVLALVALFTALQTAHKPAQAALLPHLARSPQQLAAANALWSATDNAAFLVGALVGGGLVAAATPTAAFAVTAGAFVCAAAVLAAIPRDPVPHHRSAPEKRPLRELVAGARTVASERRLRLVVGVMTFATLVEGIVDVLVVVVAIELVAIGSAGVGWLNACWGLGGVLGGAVALVLLKRQRLAAGLALGAVLVGVALTVLGAVPTLAMAATALIVLGVGYALIEVAGMTLVQRFAGDEVLARAFAVVESAYWLATGVGALIAAPLVAALGIRGALAAAGIALTVAVVARWAALARFEAGKAIPERDFDLLRQLPFFAPVPLATVETLALRVTIVPVKAGHVVIREGEPGDRFYVVAEGHLEIERGGQRCAAAHAGDFFGESALLLDCARTASVTAAEDAVLLSLRSDHFLQAVTGHPRSAAAADAIVDTRTGRAHAAA